MVVGLSHETEILHTHVTKMVMTHEPEITINYFKRVENNANM